MDDNTIEIKKSGRTKASIRQAIESELTEAKVKEVKAKLKQLVTELGMAKKVVAAKEEEIESLFADYSDIISE